MPSARRWAPSAPRAQSRRPRTGPGRPSWDSITGCSSSSHRVRTWMRRWRHTTPNDVLYSTHWGHNNRGQMRAFNYNSGQHTGAPVGTVGFDINAETGWSGPNGFGVASTIIAILDTGVNMSHPDLNIISGYDAGDNDPNPEDDSNSTDAGHGTGCAGLAAGKANN